MKRLWVALFIICTVFALSGCVDTNPPQLSEESYEIIFHTNGGEEIVSIFLSPGESLEIDHIPVLKDILFLGWFMDEALTIPFNLETMPEHDLHLYAKWQMDEYVVTVILGYENKVMTYQTVGGYFFPSSNPTRDGFEFNGYWLSDNEGITLTSSWDSNERLNQSITLYADWVEQKENTGQLESPSVSVTGSYLEWDAIEDAESYEVIIYVLEDNKNLEYKREMLSETFIDLEDYQANIYTVSIRAKGDGIKTANSSWTNRVIYHKVLDQIDNVEIDYDLNLLSWNEIVHAESYLVEYRLKSEQTYKYLNEHQYASVYLNELHPGNYVFKITVSANDYVSSVTTYEFNYLKLNTVKNLSFNKETLTLTWTNPLFATQTILDINDVEVTISDNTYTLDGDMVKPGESIIIKLKSYASSGDYLASDEKMITIEKLNTPVLTWEEHHVSWDKVEGATRYYLSLSSNSTIIPLFETSYDLVLTKQGIHDLCVIASSESSFILDSECVGESFTSFQVTYALDHDMDDVMTYVKSGSTLKKPKTFHEGYKILDFYQDEEMTKSFDFSSPITSSQTLYVKLEPKDVTVEFDLQDGNTPIEILKTPYGEMIEDKDIPVREGYRFLGYYLDPEQKDGQFFDEKMNQLKAFDTLSLKLYAHWIKYYRITLYDYFGVGQSKDIFIENGIPTEALVVPTKLGHTFVGYFEIYSLPDTIVFGSDMKPAYKVNLSRNMTVYPKYTANRYSIILNYENGSNHSWIDYTFASLMENVTIPTKTGFGFDGYYTEKNGQGTKCFTYEGKSTYQCEKTIIQNLYASWISPYKLLIKDGDLSQTIDVYYGHKLPALDTPTKEHSTFSGYYTEPQGKGNQYSFSSNNPSVWNKKEDGTLYMYWLHKVTLDFMSGEGLISSFTIRYEGLMPTLDKPKKDGYIFLGYFTEPHGLGEEIFDQDMTSDETWPFDAGMILYAHWEGIKATVTLDITHIDELDQTVYELTFGKMYELPIPTKQGYDFMGWYHYENDEVVMDTDAQGLSLKESVFKDKIELYASMKAKKVTVTFDGYFEPGEFNVSFDSDGGSLVASQIVTGEIGLDYPDNPSKQGYHFSGWYTARNGSGILYDFTTEVNQDMTLYAYWIPVSDSRIGKETWSTIMHFSYYKTTYTYTYTAQYDSYLWLVTTASAENKNLFNVSIYDNQTNKKVGEFSHNNRNYNIYLNILVQGGRSYTITVVNARNDWFPSLALQIDMGDPYQFEDGGKAGLVPATRTIEYDSEFSFPVLESSDTLLFEGWKTKINDEEIYLTDELGVGLSLWNILDNITVTPICGYERYDITYELSGGTTTESLPKQYYIGTETFELPILTKYGYDFIGWTKQDILTGEEVDITHIEKGSTGDIILKAKFEPQVFTITFVSNGGPIVPDLLVKYMEPIHFPEVIRKGYTLRYWCTTPQCNYFVPEGAAMRNDLTLYANWKVTNHQITYNMSGGVFVSTPKTTFTYFDDTFTLVDASKIGHTFNGWYSNPEFTGNKVTQILKNTDQEIILYAKFTKINYLISFKPDNGSKDTYDYNYYQDVITYPSDPIKEGYQFIGWFDEMDLETEFTRTSMPATNVYLIAKYEKVDYAITFNYDDADTVGIESKVARIDEAYGSLPIPTKENHTFEGWYTEKEEGILITSSTLFNALQNQMLYPRFELIHIVRYTDEGANNIPLEITLRSGLYNESEALDQLTQKGYIILSDDSFISITYHWFFSQGYDKDVTDGYLLESTIVGNFPDYLEIINPTAILWTLRPGDMRQVGLPETYHVPIYTTYHLPVFGGYSLAETETTYYDWYLVRIWAEQNGYTFRNKGKEGSMGVSGEKPTENRYHPVTGITHQDAYVWLNALSELLGYEPIYTLDGKIYKNSSQWGVLGLKDVLGFSLPTEEQYIMANLYKNDTVSTNGSILKDGRYWAPSNYPSGSVADYNNLAEAMKVSCFEQLTTCEVRSLRANDLGLYDMSGNVSEMVYHKNNMVKGGSFKQTKFYLQPTSTDFSSTYDGANHVGFRIMMNPYPNAVPVVVKKVGENKVYDVPTTINNVFGSSVIGGFQLAETETTYGLWKKVYNWAIQNGYKFIHNGLGENQTLDDNVPVTNISFIDVIVWMNALSEMNSYSARYYSGQGTIIKDATNPIITIDNIIVNNEKGYRLPSSVEWEMAARWTTRSFGDATIEGTSKRWLIGATLNGHHYLGQNFSEYVCYSGNCSPLPKPVKSKKATDLGLYDLSGNVFEYVFNTYVPTPTVRGTDIMNAPTYESALIHHVTYVGIHDVSPFVGFRILLD